jgi:cyclopropane fatty-acyl-phospholipid synthase-like methyltransferase
VAGVQRMTATRPYSEACERNREPILHVLREAFAQARHVLEIGSGTGQHAVYFGEHLPHLTWQTSDAPEHHGGINAWRAAGGPPNVHPPLALDVRDDPWPVAAANAVFTANTLHIMDWDCVAAFFRGVNRVLTADGVLAVYGPFNYRGQFTSASNAQFDALLRARGVGSALRDFEAVDALARGIGLALVRDEAMPANNRTLVWRRQGGA